MVKQIVDPPYHGILFSTEKEQNIRTPWMNLQRIILGRKKPIQKGYKVYDSIYIAFLK